MISYSVIGSIDKLIGSPPSARTRRMFPVGVKVIVHKGFIIDDYEQDEQISEGVRGKVIEADAAGIKVKFATGTTLTFGDCIANYLI